MRRAGDEPNGLTEALVVAAIETGERGRAGCREPQLRRLRPRDGGGRGAQPQPAAAPAGAAALSRPVPARTPGSLQRQIPPVLAGALPRLRRADLPPPVGPPRAPSRGLPPGSRRGSAAEVPSRGARLAPRGDRRRRDLRRAYRVQRAGGRRTRHRAPPARPRGGPSLRLVLHLRQAGRPDAGGVPLSAEGPPRHPPDRARTRRAGDSHGPTPPRHAEHALRRRARRSRPRARAKALSLPARGVDRSQPDRGARPS